MKKHTYPIKRFMKGVMLKYVPGMITCAEFEQFIDDYLDSSLPEKQVLVFEKHITMCAECRDYLEAYRNAITLGKKALAKQEASTTVPNTVPADLLQAMLEARQIK